MKNAIIWDITPRGCYKVWYFGGTCRLHHQVDKNQQTWNNIGSNLQLKNTAKKYALPKRWPMA
jgi:hypothetical protein